MITARLGIGPMSTEIIEAVFQYSAKHKEQLMLIATLNQINSKQGYVNRWSTADYASYLKSMKSKYPDADVLSCRDHCGPGFSIGQDVFENLKTDLENGFDLIHLDFCHFDGTHEQKIESTIEALQFCRNIRPDVAFEIGTDEITGEVPSVARVEKDLDSFLEHCMPEFYVVNTGTQVRECWQAGEFNKKAAGDFHELLASKNVKLKEHNSDYLEGHEIQSKRGVVDAINMAPMLGVYQTQTIMKLAAEHQLNGALTDWMNEVYEGKRWCKWTSSRDEEHCVICGGHYHFSGDNYQKLMQSLGNPAEKLIDVASKAINHYAKHFC